jgi:2-dehydro-3-deoxyglucarate aldolase
VLSKIKKKLKKGQVTIGSWMQIPSTSVAEIMGKAGYDWVAVDLEHGHFSTQVLPDIFRALELGGTAPFARVAQCKSKDVRASLDAGARGIILPMIQEATQLKSAIEWGLYPPKGIRGVGYSRANFFGKDFDFYLATSLQETIFIAQIENIQAVENLDEILKVEGLDAIMVGSYDLSSSMNLTAEFRDPRFIKTMEIISQKANKYRVPMGLHIVKPVLNELEKSIEKGYQFIAYSIDAVFLYESAEKPKQYF